MAPSTQDHHGTLVHRPPSPETAPESNAPTPKGSTIAPEPRRMDNKDYLEWSMNELQRRGYTTVYKGFHSAPKSDRIKGLMWFGVFVTTWILSCLFPMFMILSFFIKGMWPIGVVMAGQWFIVRVVLKDHIESEQWRNSWLANFLQRKVAVVAYYAASSISSFELKDDKHRPPTMLAFHPHGIFSLGWSLCVCTHLATGAHLKGFRCLFADSLYLTPFFFSWCNLFQAFGGVNGAYMKKVMSKGESVAIIPGGFEEATIHHHEEDRLYLRSRKGFVAFAMRYGYELRPVFTFGERLSYKNYQGLMSLRLWINTLPLKLPAVLPYGRNWMFPVLPRKDTVIHTVVGPPMRFTKTPNATHEQVDRAHAEYIANLQALYAELGPILDPTLQGDYKIQIW